MSLDDLSKASSSASSARPGCGKTTLLRAIAGLDLQSSGRIEQDGRDISVLPPSRARFRHRLPVLRAVPEPDGREQCRLRSAQAQAAAAAEIAARVNELLDSSVWRIRIGNIRLSFRAASSSGSRWRGRSPCRPGCCCSMSRCRRSTRGCACVCAARSETLQRRLGVTTIMVTHDQEEALTMADRIVVMNHGGIEQVGTPLEIYRGRRAPTWPTSSAP